MQHFARSLALFIFVLFLSQAVSAQDVDREAFQDTDSLVSALGPMQDSSLKRIVRSTTALCRDQACLVRAIYKWIINNIEYDCLMAGRPERVNNSASNVLATRKGTSLGYANLVAEMCRIAGLSCSVVTGLAKWDSEHIGRVDNKTNSHSWNVVQARNRWFVLDASHGAGFCEGRDFVSQQTDAWFLTNRKLFALCHFPHDKRLQLLDTPIERAAFIAAPVIGPTASVFGIFPMQGQRGILRGRQDSSLLVSFVVRPIRMMERIISVSVIAAGILKEIPFSKTEDILTVIIPFPKEGKYPVTLLVNNGNVMSFRAEVLPRLIRSGRN